MQKLGATWNSTRVLVSLKADGTVSVWSSPISWRQRYSGKVPGSLRVIKLIVTQKEAKKRLQEERNGPTDKELTQNNDRKYFTLSFLKENDKTVYNHGSPKKGVW